MNYSSLIEAIHVVHTDSRRSVAGAVNRHLVLRNWMIGAYLIEYEQNGEDRAQYGAKLLEILARDLQAKGSKGLGVSMLRIARRFYNTYPQIRQTLSTESFALPEDQIRQTLSAESNPPVLDGPTPFYLDNSVAPRPRSTLILEKWGYLPFFALKGFGKVIRQMITQTSYRQSQSDERSKSVFQTMEATVFTWPIWEPPLSP